MLVTASGTLYCWRRSMQITSWLWCVHQEPWECLALVLKAKMLSSVFSSVLITMDLLFELDKKKVYKKKIHTYQNNPSWVAENCAPKPQFSTSIIRSHQCHEHLPACDGSGIHLCLAFHYWELLHEKATNILQYRLLWAPGAQLCIVFWDTTRNWFLYSNDFWLVIFNGVFLGIALLLRV